MLKALLTLMLTLTLVACASRRAVEDVQVPPPTAAPGPKPKPQIKYVYIDRTLPTVSAMTMSPLDVPAARDIDIWQDIGRILWPLIALLGAGAVMIAGLYAEHIIIDKQLTARRLRKSQSVS